jgi:hypothetical protein
VRVIAASAREDVVAGSPVQLVFTELAVHGVVAVLAVERVICISREDLVVARFAVYGFGVERTGYDVVFGRAVARVSRTGESGR